MKMPSRENVARLVPRVLILVLSLAMGPVLGFAQTEEDITVAYLYNFGRSVEWPASAFASSEAHFTIGIVGRPTLAENLAQATRNKNIAGREVTVRKLS